MRQNATENRQLKDHERKGQKTIPENMPGHLWVSPERQERRVNFAMKPSKISTIPFTKEGSILTLSRLLGEQKK